MTPVVLTEMRGAVLVITLNRPDVRNAVDSAVAAAIADALDALDADSALAVGVLTGAGKGFSAGMDLRAFTEGDLGLAGDRGFAGITRRAAEKPLIAAVEGFALAGGFEIALACDLIVAAAGARFGLPEVSRSLLAAAGGLRRLPARAPESVAYEIALTGQPITAERAYEVGIVNRLAEPGRALDVALELAAAIAENGPLALTATKQILREQSQWSDDEFWARQDEVAAALFASEDTREGALAFLEKRRPVWRRR